MLKKTLINGLLLLCTGFAAQITLLDDTGKPIPNAGITLLSTGESFVFNNSGTANVVPGTGTFSSSSMIQSSSSSNLNTSSSSNITTTLFHTQNEIKAYANSNGWFFEGLDKGLLQWTVYDYSGKVLISKSEFHSGGTWQLDRQSSSIGFVKIQTKQGNFSYKLSPNGISSAQIPSRTQSPLNFIDTVLVKIDNVPSFTVIWDGQDRVISAIKREYKGQLYTNVPNPVIKIRHYPYYAGDQYFEWAAKLSDTLADNGYITGSYSLTRWLQYFEMGDPSTRAYLYDKNGQWYYLLEKFHAEQTYLVDFPLMNFAIAISQ